MLTASMINSHDTERALPSCRNSGCSNDSTLIRRRLANAQFLGAATGLAGGVLTGLLGAIFTVAGWFVANEGARHWLSNAGTTLLFLTIPLILFGGYCLDWMEKNKS